MLPYAIVGFLSAFLLFQVQPVIAKLILPWFGGSSGVWTTCMLFFQVLLLGGYLYSHWLYNKLPLRAQALVHSVLLTASVLALPILPNAAWKPGPGDDPLFRILGVLAASVGLPYFLLSTTSPLLQAWYSRTHKGAVPYRLFALSNAGSLLALLTYPVLIEPLLSTRYQGRIWSAAYILFAASCAWIAWSTARRAPFQGPVATGEQAEAGSPPSTAERLVWLLLAACASTLLLSATTFLTQDVAAVPFLWILPLSVYLLSFILCFDAPRYYNRAVFLPLLLLALGGMAYIQREALPSHWMVQAIAGVTASLFVFCMVCHGELARRKPHPRYLTDFYVMISVGGACGGLFVGVAAPMLFNAYYEFPAGLALCAVLTALLLLRDWDAWFRTRRRWMFRIPILILVPVYVAGLAYFVRQNAERSRVMVRNFYGQMRVRDIAEPGQQPYRILVHGLINHGYQFMSASRRREAVSYFCADTGIGRALLDRKPGRPIRMGILGLGIGTLAAYGRPGDVIRIYEINPQVVDLANHEFSYLKDTPAKVEVVLGDGRLSLEREPSQQFDILVMDAFSGDSVPVHLLTREAFAIYFRHLRPGGVLALNVSNRHLNLAPVMEQNAVYYGKAAWWFDFEPDEDDAEERCFDASWTLIVDPSTEGPGGKLYQVGHRLVPDPYFRAWTDDFSNLYAIIKK